MKISSIEDINYALLSQALSFIGLREVPGKMTNQQITDMFIALGFDTLDEETPWCAAFVGYILKKAGLSYPRTLSSRKYADYGVAVENPRPGNIVVLWRDSLDSQFGHVGIWLHSDDSTVWILGGNQDNSVSIQLYPKHRIIAVRQAVSNL